MKDCKCDDSHLGESKSYKKWIQKATDPKKKGQLHKDLGVPQDEKIPASKLKSAAKKGGKVGQRARFAMNLSKLNESELKTWIESHDIRSSCDRSHIHRESRSRDRDCASGIHGSLRRLAPQ